MKKIIYTRPDGGLSVVHPVINTHVVVDDELVPHVEDITEDEALERAINDVPLNEDGEQLPYQIVDESSIPTDRTFRAAWKAGAGRVEHDMTKCRAIHQNTLRAMRAPKLAALDVEFMRALEVNDTAKATLIAQKKQALRDVTTDPAISAAATPEQLKAVLPEVLR